jgi:hypothetical protein
MGDSVKVRWTHPNETDVFHWVVYYQYGSKWEYRILNRGARELVVNSSLSINNQIVPLGKVMVTAVDRVGNESGKE